MGIIEILLISIGLSFDVFVVHICVGAGFSRKHGKDTLLSSLIFGGMQLFALILGNVVADILKPDRKMNETISTAASGWEILSVLIFIGLGIYMICKARNNKQIFERRNDEINWKRLRKLALLTSVDAYFAGMGIGFWSVEILEQGMVLLPVTIIQCFLGVEVGYRLGCEYNCKAYWIGGILFLIAGADMVVTHFLF